MRIALLVRPFALAVAVVLFSSLPVAAGPVVLHFSDPVGDGSSRTDLTGMDMTFDNVTGAYTIVMTATSAKPFTDHFRLNVNLFDVDRDSTTQNTGYFADDFHDYDLGVSSALTMSWSGVNAVLKNWMAGDRVAINEHAFGVPAFYALPPVSMSAFHTEVLDFSADTTSGTWGGEDQVYGDPGYATVQSVPDAASTLLLLAFSLASLKAFRKRLG
jgi:hypothetical protein